MPVHRSITRINNNENKDIAIHVCCGIILCFIFLSIILSNHNVDINTILLILIFLFLLCIFCPFCVLFYKCHFNIDTDTDTDTDISSNPFHVVMNYEIRGPDFTFNSNDISFNALL